MFSEHERLMELALREAELAAEENEVPVGCIILFEGTIIARDHNRREQLKDPTAHAEILAISQAASALNSWRLDQCQLYVTLEPCPMCAGAIIQARIPVVVYGADDPKAGACKSLYTITQDKRLNHRAETIPGILAPECGQILTRFFAKQRAMGKK